MMNGVKQWLFQRIANAVFILFGIGLLWVFASADGTSFAALSELFAKGWVKLFLVVTLVFACVNGILAGWQIEGDYAKKFSMPSGVLTWTAILVGILYLIFGLKILF